MKQPYGSTLPVAPTVGDVVYLDDGSIHFCFADGVWTAVGSAGTAGGGTFQYGTFGFAIANETGLARSNFPEWVRYKAADIFGNEALYYRCQWDIMEVDDGGTIYNVWEGQTFADTAALYAFVSANFPAGSSPGTPGNHAVAKVYDVIDPTVPKIDKIWGINSFYSMLKGRSSYRNPKYCINGTPNWSDFSNWFEDLCDQNIGFGTGHTYVANDERALWFSRTDKKLYGLPTPGYSCNLGTNGSRWVWNNGAVDFITLPAVRSYHNNPSSGEQRLYCALILPGATNWEWFTPGDTTPLIQSVASDNRSFIVLYQLEDGSDANNRSIHVKPYGVDRLGLNWFDSSTYDLFAMYTRKNQTPIQREITSLGLSSAVKDLQWVEYGAWIPPEWGASRARLSLNMVGHQPYTTQFFLRHNTTNVVSPVSKARVVRTQRHRDAPFKYEVRR